MADRPTIVPEHCNTGTNTEPPTDFLNDGTTAGISWPAQYINWVLKNIITWIAWFAGKTLQRSSVSDKTPVLATCDRSANIRTWLDASGYTNGPAIQEHYVWGPRDLSVTTATGTLLSSKDRQELVYGHAQTTVSVSTSTRSNAPILQLSTIGSTSVGEGAIIANGESPPIANIDDTVIVWESSFEVSDITDECDHYMGLSDLDQASGAADPATLDDSSSFSALFIVLYNDSNLWLQTTNGTAISLDDSGITIVNDTRYYLRVEYHGSNSPIGVAESNVRVARFFINGTMVHEEVAGTAPSGASAKLGSVIATRRVATNAGVVLRVGPTRLNYNDILDPSASIPT